MALGVQVAGLVFQDGGLTSKVLRIQFRVWFRQRSGIQGSGISRS